MVGSCEIDGTRWKVRIESLVVEKFECLRNREVSEDLNSRKIGAQMR